MSQSPSSEALKGAGRPSKRKGTRSVSSLTPQQLTRKRANDREAQRAIRLRTRQHIQQLEETVKELQNRKLQERLRDAELQKLVERNGQLEREVAALRGEGRPYPVPGFDPDGLPPAGSAVRGRAPSIAQMRPEYSGPPPLGPSYLPTPEPCEAWPTTVVPTSSAVTLPSGVSSPCSSAGPGDEYVANYIPMSVPSSMMGGGGMMPNTAVSCLGNPKAEYEDLDTGMATGRTAGQYGLVGYNPLTRCCSPATDQGYTSSQTSPSYITHQSWPMYPAAPYFSTATTL
ncbi:hypothetical protein BT67DRAFT_43692 [Trichocladium antarcticum]|uniref:BZIP transcription factor n=1 Tax=Trichocladium antarcticum TaxID=1450529 RepID=A0AAN6UJI0_9PEZI|nr:hypothetical protein BT67DRAFT_43692 [Trichocladium antarcticum]